VRAETPTALRAAASGERRIVFQAALEQAQQQYMAASAIGYESRPLNLFYGLAQAGKALAAASDRLEQRKPGENFKSWKSGGHGLTFAPDGGGFWRQKVTVGTSRSDSFSRASIALASSYDFESIELGALAAQIPEFAMEWRGFNDWPRCIHADDAMVDSANGVFDLRDFKGESTVAAIEAYIAHYPALSGATVAVNNDGTPADRTGDRMHYVIVPQDQMVRPSTYRGWPKGSRPYGGSVVVLPRPGSAAGDLHPLMCWWLLLFGFSILARYHPKEWTEALAIGTSPVASQVEFLLDAAVAAVPELLAREWWVPPWE
jgi:hypothetical protein